MILKNENHEIDFPFNQGKYGSLQLSLSSGLLFLRKKSLVKVRLVL